MKKLLLLALASTTVFLRAQDDPAFPPSVSVPAAGESSALAPLNAEQLDQLLGPIALYPDALIALILPAATFPADVVLAARYLKDNRNEFGQIENRAWDDSVKSLAHYPDVLNWLDDNLLWTKQLGEAFATQPAEVMNAIQRLRARARAAGTLVDTPQQQVLVQPDVIRIVPAQPDVIYVPYYDPQIVYVEQPVYYPRPMMSFSIGWGVGSWLAYDFDWHRRSIWVGDRHRRWSGGHDWHRPIVPIPPVTQTVVVTRTARPWQPGPRPPRPSFAVGESFAVGNAAGTRSYPRNSPAALDPANDGGRSLVTNRPARTNPGAAVRGIPAPTTALASPAIVNSAPPQVPNSPAPSYRPRLSDATRTADLSSRARTYQPPTNSVASAPSLQMASPAPQNYPTVVTPPQRSNSRPYLPGGSAPVYTAPAQSPQQYRAPTPAYTVPMQAQPQYRSPAPSYTPPAQSQPQYRSPAPSYTPPPQSAPQYHAPAPAPAAAPAPAQSSPPPDDRRRPDRRSID